MPFKKARIDETVLERNLNEVVQETLSQVDGDYARAIELVFTPREDKGGVSPSQLVRRGELSKAHRLVADILDDERRAREAAQKAKEAKILVAAKVFRSGK